MIRKLDIVFAAILCLIVFLFGASLLVIQSTPRTFITYQIRDSAVNVPMPGWYRFEKGTAG